MTYQWSGGALRWLQQQGIEPYEVEQALQSKRRWPRPGFIDGRVAVTVWGETALGRRLMVILRDGSLPFDKYIIAAYELSAAQSAEFTEHWES